MLAVDTFLGNNDRVRARGINFGNVMVSDDFVIQAIDSDSTLNEIEKGDLEPKDVKGVEEIASGNVTQTVEDLKDRIRTTLTTDDYRLLKRYLEENGIDIFAQFDLVKQGVKLARDIIIGSSHFKDILANPDVYTTVDFDPRELERRRKYLKYRRRKGRAKALRNVKGNRTIR